MKAAFALAAVVGAVAAAPALADKPHLQGYRWISDTPQPTHFITDTLAPGGGTSQAVTVSSSNGFAWADAGIGAAAAAGTILVLLGGSVLLVRRRTHLAV